ncbi:MAG: DUF2267 domain-containing protein [Actinomycetota bacterium]|nr:DUF2267 domain-containing protein [Actinomycetota bacterium]
MKHDEFIGQVQHRARLDSRGAAERAVRATLETLGERLEGGAPDKLAAQLPQEIGEHLRRMEGESERFDLDGFFERVTRREGVDPPEAVFHARCVVEVVEEATTPGTMAKIRDQLPSDYERLFAAGSTGPMPGN